MFSRYVHITLGLQSGNCLTLSFSHFELSKFSSPNSSFSELSTKTLYRQ